jgi:uncharacterized protein (DUF2141 family)
MAKLFYCILFLKTIFSSPEKLEVIVNNIQVGKGSVVVEIYNNDKNFFTKPIATKTVKATNKSLDFSFDISDGIYAVAVYQDINENKQLDKGWFSIPKEPYGLSNNYRPHFSGPSFNDCKFKVTQETTVTILLK